MNKKTATTACIITAVLVFILTSMFYHTSAGLRVFSLFGDAGMGYDYAKLVQIDKMIEDNYTGSYNKDRLMNAALFSYVASLGDEHSSYLGKSEYKSFSESLSGDYRGIGITVGYGEGKILIKEVTPASPADEAGIKKGDFLIKVNGEEYNDNQIIPATDAIRNTPEGESVILTIEREGSLFDLTVTPRDIANEYVIGSMIDEGIGYINIKTFGNNIVDEFAGEINNLKEKGMKKLILDLRSNPGGSLDSAVGVGDILLPKGDIITIKDKYDKSQSYKSDETELGMPIFVLINEDSASASEVIAGALRDYDKGVLIGKKTYGKGVVQSIYEFGDGTGLRLTTAKYYTPSGECIHGTGIEPDIEVELGEGASISYGDLTRPDPQLERALAEARGAQ